MLAHHVFGNYERVVCHVNGRDVTPDDTEVIGAYRTNGMHEDVATNGKKSCTGGPPERFCV